MLESPSTVAAPAMAPAIISPCTSRLRTLASISPARSWLNCRMLSTRASRPKTLRKTMRRVRLEKLCATKNCQEWRAAPSGPSVRSTCQASRKNPPVPPTARCAASAARRAQTRRSAAARRRLSFCRARRKSAAARNLSEADCRACVVRSSTRDIPVSFVAPRLAIAAGYRLRWGRPRAGALHFLEAIADTVERLDHIEIVVALLEFLAQAFDVAVDRAVVHVDLIVIGGIHQRIAAFHHARAGRERLQDEELGHRQRHRLALPGAGVALRIHAQQPALEDLGGVRFLRHRRVLRRAATQDRLDALDQQSLRERFADEVVRAHLQAEQLVDLLILGGEEDHGHVGLLAQPSKHLHPVHAGHLDVQDGEIGRRGLEAVQRRSAVGVGHDAISFRLECDRDRGQDIAIIIHQSDCRHWPFPWRLYPVSKPLKRGRNVTRLAVRRRLSTRFAPLYGQRANPQSW